jgi:hypothetical protein
VELELFHYRIEESKSRDAILIGGLYCVENRWTFTPVVKKFRVDGGWDEIHQTAAFVWEQELAARGILDLGNMNETLTL